MASSFLSLESSFSSKAIELYGQFPARDDFLFVSCLPFGLSRLKDRETSLDACVSSRNRSQEDYNSYDVPQIQ
jgi:hypothetical protein